MDKNRESFMANAGDVSFELDEVGMYEKNGIDVYSTTESTPFFSIFCC